MKFNKLFMALGLVALISIPAIAEIPENLTFSMSVDLGYYTDSKMLYGTPTDHYAPITGPYSGVEGRVVGNVDYKIPTPFGEHWLLCDANVTLNGSLEVTPVTVKPGLKATLTPLPFLVFSAGAELGYGWDALGVCGMGIYNTETNKYESTDALFYKWWAQGTFQFDTGALIPGDWSHVVMMYTYQVYYEDFAGLKDSDIFCWQGSKTKVGELRNYQCGILAYQMPLVLYRVGAMIELDGLYVGVNLPEKYDPDFMSISISPLAQFQITEKDTLNVLAGFSSRRCLDYADENVADHLKESKSREWHFNRFALSYTHTF